MNKLRTYPALRFAIHTARNNTGMVWQRRGRFYVSLTPEMDKYFISRPEYRLVYPVLYASTPPPKPTASIFARFIQQWAAKIQKGKIPTRKREVNHDTPIRRLDA